MNISNIVSNKINGLQITSIFEDEFKFDEEKAKLVIKLSTSYWSDKKGMNYKKTITFLKRKSNYSGLAWIEADLDGAGAEFLINSIINLDKCQDGIYELITCNHSRDFETGYDDGYDYKLVPYVEKKD